jgi:hypothetical protein
MFSADLLHPDERGHRLWAEAVDHAIRSNGITAQRTPHQPPSTGGSSSRREDQSAPDRR